MGHYYAEMACHKCGRPHCVCPPKPTPERWYVTSHFGVTKQLPRIYSPDRVFFDTKAEAEAAVPGMIRARINELSAEVDLLEGLLMEIDE